MMHPKFLAERKMKLFGCLRLLEVWADLIALHRTGGPIETPLLTRKVACNK